MTDVFNFSRAIIVDSGPKESEWVKVQLTNGEEAFLYPDKDDTVDLKVLEEGHELIHRNLRPCTKPGQTKWVTNAHNIKFQPTATREFLHKKGRTSIVSYANVETPIESKSPDRVITKIALDIPTSKWFRELLMNTPYADNRAGVSKLAVEMISVVKDEGLMSKYYGAKK